MPGVPQDWDSPPQDLDDTIHTFPESAKELLGVPSQPPYQAAEDISLGAAIDTVYCDFQSLDSRYKALDDAQYLPAKIRNSAAPQMSFNRLPTEIITRIFCYIYMGSCSCSTSATLALAPEPDLKTLFALPHVCSRWRDIALDTPYLWSHVVFDSQCENDLRDGPNLPQLFLERARDSKLYIHLVGSGWDPDARSMYPQAIDRRLRPHLKNLVGVFAEGYWHYWNTFASFWGEGDANSLQEFINTGQYEVYSSLVETFSPSPPPHLRVIRLQVMHFPWDCPVYNNLVDLRLGFLAAWDFPTMRRLLGILSACPDLRALGLHGWVNLKPEEYDSGLVLLKSLELLDVTHLRGDGIAKLLPMLAFGQVELSVRLSNQDIYTEDCKSGIQSLLTRANVTRLYVKASYDCNVAACLTHACNLRILVLDFRGHEGDTPLKSITSPAHPRSAIRPELQSLYLINGSVSKRAIRIVAEAYLLQKLTFGCCSVKRPAEETLEWLKPMVKCVRDVPQLNKALDYNWHLCMD